MQDKIGWIASRALPEFLHDADVEVDMKIVQTAERVGAVCQRNMILCLWPGPKLAPQGEPENIRL